MSVLRDSPALDGVRQDSSAAPWNCPNRDLEEFAVEWFLPGPKADGAPADPGAEVSSLHRFAME